MRVWTINGDFAAFPVDGVARYAREITLALDAMMAEGHPLTDGLRVRLVTPKADPSLELQRIEPVVLPEFQSPRLPQVWVQLQLPRHVEGGLLSFCNLAPVLVRKHIACIHDLHTFLMPESYGRGFRWAHRTILPWLGRSAAALTTVSAFSRDHLVRFGIAPEDKITVAPNGYDHALRWQPDTSEVRAWPDKPFILGLGRPQAYKNTELFWSLARLLEPHGIAVVLAGRIGDAEALYGPLPPNLQLVGRISDDALADGLRRALAFAFPSRIEGFGIPAVEAMAWDCPLVCSTEPALPEVCGDAALYAHPDQPEAWAAHILSLVREPGLRDGLRARAQNRRRAFTWRQSAQVYLGIMARLDGSAP